MVGPQDSGLGWFRVLVASGLAGPFSGLTSSIFLRSLVSACCFFGGSVEAGSASEQAVRAEGRFNI